MFHHLYGRVVYAVDLHGWEPAGLGLVEISQDNPLLDAHRQVLAAEFPRRKFGTELKIAVGGLRADVGTYYTGRDRPQGLAKLAELQRAHKLGLVSGWHLISKTFDHDDHGRDERTAVCVEAWFSRPPRPEVTPQSLMSVQATGSFGDRNLDDLVAAAWRTFQLLVDVAPVASADVVWNNQRDDDLNPDERPMAPFMMFGGSDVTKLGGAKNAAERLEAFDWNTVRGDESNGVVVQLGRRPEDTTGDRLNRIRAQVSTL